MILPIYVGKGWGKLRASFDPLPCSKLQHLIVPGGSSLLPMRLPPPDRRMLFTPTRDLRVFVGWTAREAIQASVFGHSMFRLIQAKGDSVR